MSQLMTHNEGFNAGFSAIQHGLLALGESAEQSDALHPILVHLMGVGELFWTLTLACPLSSPAADEVTCLCYCQRCNANGKWLALCPSFSLNVHGEGSPLQDPLRSSHAALAGALGPAHAHPILTFTLQRELLIAAAC